LDKRKEEVMHKTQEVEELMIQLFADRKNAEDQTKKVAEKKKRVEEEVKVVHEEARAAQEELNKVQPGLDKAKELLKLLNPKDVAEVRAYTTPPQMVMTVMSAVMILFKGYAGFCCLYFFLFFLFFFFF
jgi:dynein heavy chain